MREHDLEPLLAAAAALGPAAALRFQRALVSVALDLLQHELPPIDKDVGERQGGELARKWLRQPTAEVVDQAVTWMAAECWDGGVRHHDYPVLFHGPLEIATASTAAHASRRAVAFVTRLAARRGAPHLVLDHLDLQRALLAAPD